MDLLRIATVVVFCLWPSIAYAQDCNNNSIPDIQEMAYVTPLGYWRFEEPADPVVDTGPNNLSGVLGGTAYRTGEVPITPVPQFGAANLSSVNLSGSGYVSIEDPTGKLTIGDRSFTIETWVNLSVLAPTSGAGYADRQCLCQKKPIGGGTSTSGDGNLDYAVLIQRGDSQGTTNYGYTGSSGRKLQLVIGTGSPSYSTWSVTSNLGIETANTWNYVSVAFDATNHLVRFTLNSQADSVSFSSSHPAHAANAGPLVMGVHTTKSGVYEQYLQGQVDEFRMALGIVATSGQLNVSNPHDCNRNAILDECDVAGGTSADCNANGTPDECELPPLGTGSDCNANQILDSCDIASSLSLDCNTNGIPDECDIKKRDCNRNGQPDSCDIANGTSLDADHDGIPDECPLKMTAFDGATEDKYGNGVAVDGQRLVIGAPEDNNPAIARDVSGSVYVYKQDGGKWVLEQKLYSDDPDGFDGMGACVAIDGDTIAAGAPESGLLTPGENYSEGAVFLFQRINGVWTQTQRLHPAGLNEQAQFGRSLALQGDLLAVGAYRQAAQGISSAGVVYVYRREAGTWVLEKEFTSWDAAQDDGFGWDLSLSNGMLLIGAPADDDQGQSCGAAYAYQRVDRDWYPRAKFVMDAGTYMNFGKGVAISGSLAVIGMPRPVYAHGSAYFFHLENGHWKFMQRVEVETSGNVDSFGAKVALFGNRAAIRAEGDDEFVNNSGAVYVYDYIGGTWVQTAKLKANDPESEQFGSALAVSPTGQVVIGVNEDDDKGFNSGGVFVATMAYSDQKGACCDELTGQCTDDVAISNCYGRFASDMSCAALYPSCEMLAGACCEEAEGLCWDHVLPDDCQPPARFGGVGSTCATMDPPCPATSATGACCYPDYTCAITTQAACNGHGNWLLANTTCGQCPPPPVTGSCCYLDGSCTVTTQVNCVGGTWTQNGVCTPNTCPQPTGACCNVVTFACTITTQAACVGAFLGVGTNCTPANKCCVMLGDVNGSNTVDGKDIQGFVNAFIGTYNGCADFDNNSKIDSQDISGLITALLGAAPATCTLLGDLNADGLVDGKDIQGLTNCIIAGGTGCPCGDLNGDSQANTEDIPAFLTKLLGP